MRRGECRARDSPGRSTSCVLPQRRLLARYARRTPLAVRHRGVSPPSARIPQHAVEDADAGRRSRDASTRGDAPPWGMRPAVRRVDRQFPVGGGRAFHPLGQRRHRGATRRPRHVARRRDAVDPVPGRLERWRTLVPTRWPAAADLRRHRCLPRWLVAARARRDHRWRGGVRVRVSRHLQAHLPSSKVVKASGSGAWDSRTTPQVDGPGDDDRRPDAPDETRRRCCALSGRRRERPARPADKSRPAVSGWRADCGAADPAASRSGRRRSTGPWLPVRRR